MTLQELAQLLNCEPRAVSATPILGVTENSKRVTPGYVFVAARGEKLDGHDFAAWAVSSGAIAVIGNRHGVYECAGVPYFPVDKPRQAAGILAHAIAGEPSRAMTVIGITGTNGKTSTALMTQRILTQNNHPCACFGTLGYDVAGELKTAAHTTPFGEELAPMFKAARDAGQTHVVMETSSHAIEQERIAGIKFTVGAFTNLTQDHLDYHQDMDQYLRAKLMLFKRIEGQGCFTVVNAADPSASRFVEASRVPCYTYGPKGNVRATGVRVDAERTCFSLHTPWGKEDVEMNLLGKHNVSNALCAATVCAGLGVSVDRIAGAIAGLERVPGRFEHVPNDKGFQVIVDYAHTEDGLRNVLSAAREVCRGRVICVFGCGGDRDKTKRPLMGQASAELSDYSIVTSDNPRSEDPERILLDIEVGLQRAGKRKYDNYEMILDRAEAIRTSIKMAKPGDLVMIAGKGHEDYQILGSNRIHFDDREVAQDILNEN